MMTSQQTCPFLLDLGSPEATLDRVGGKGASLARMVAAGLPVPPGFHITTDAYDRFVAENHLGDGILSAVAQAQADAPATLERASEQIQSVIAQGTIPGDIAEMIRQRYANLGADAPVAVRSSATAEDFWCCQLIHLRLCSTNVCPAQRTMSAISTRGRLFNCACVLPLKRM
jgi:hypothetical protein